MGTYGYIKHSELSHHGIKGQRWGVRNGPPYPLSESDRSTKERKLNPTSKFIVTHVSGKNKYAQNNIANIFKGTPENAAMKNTPGGKQWITNKEVGKTVAKAYAKEFAGKGTYKAISKEVGKGAVQVVSGNRNPIKKTKFYQNYRNNQIRNKFKRFENESEKIAQNKMNLFRKLDDEKFNFLDKEIKKYGFDDMEDAYAKAAKENSLLDSGKLKYQDSIWKKINDIEEKADDEFFNREYKISRDADKQTNKHAEKFLNNYFKDHTKLTSDTLDKIATKEYNGEHDSWVSGMGPTRLRSEMLNQDNASKYELDNDLIIRRKKKR